MSRTLAEVFSTDPLELSKQDIDEVVARYREAAAQFNLGARSPGATKKVAPEGTEKISIVDLKALGLIK